MNTMPFEKCPVCGGDLVEKEVEKVLRGGGQYRSLEGLRRDLPPLRREALLAGDCEEVRTDQGQAGAPGNRRVSGNRSLLSGCIIRDSV